MKKLLSLLLGLFLLFGSACAQSYTMAGFDGQDADHDWSQNAFFTRMEAKTGISFTYDCYTDSTAWQAAKSAMFQQGGVLPDVLFKAALTADEIQNGLDNGKLVDLAPLLPEYAPHLWALLQEHPDWLEAITLPDGRIGALPTLTEQPTQNALWINQSWLTKLGLSMPTDWESLKAVLIAFRDNDPNGNGKKDEIPLSFLSVWDLRFLSQADGVVVNDYNVYQAEDGSIHYWPLEESFTELAQTLRDFYKEGLLDTNGFTGSDTQRTITSNDSDLTYGAFFAPSPMSLVTVEMSKSFVLLTPLEADGKRIWRDLGQDVVTGSFAITTACSNPEQLLSWVDILYTEEGAIEAMVGIEGQDYTVTEDGRWSYSEDSSLTSLNALSVYDSGNMPWYFPKAFYQRFSDDEIARMCNCLDELSSYVQKPVLRTEFTGENRQELIQLQKQLGTFVDVTLSRWIMGDLELNEETISAFRQELESLGASDMTALWEKQLGINENAQ